MRKSLIGAMCAGLVMAGAAVAVTPGVAAAEDASFLGYKLSVVDRSGGFHGVSSQFGAKANVSVRFTSASRPKCTLRIAPDGDDLARPVFDGSLSVTRRTGDNTVVGSKTTAVLKPGYYYAATSCTYDGGKQASKFDTFQIVDAPPVTFAGTATCLDPASGKFVRPKSLRISLEAGDKKVPLTTASATASKFSVKVYDTVVRAGLGCLGTASNLGYFENVGYYEVPGGPFELVATHKPT